MPHVMFSIMAQVTNFGIHGMEYIAVLQFVTVPELQRGTDYVKHNIQMDTNILHTQYIVDASFHETIIFVNIKNMFVFFLPKKYKIISLFLYSTLP